MQKTRARKPKGQTVPTIAYFIHGRGRGHASPALDVIQVLRAQGYEVRVYAGGDALTLCGEDPHLETITPIPRGLAGLQTLIRRIPLARHSLKRHGVDLVITDGDAPGLFAGHILGLPTIALGHSMVFATCHTPPFSSWSRLVESINAGSASIRATRKVVLHFLNATPKHPQTIVARPDLKDLEKFQGEHASPSPARELKSPIELCSYFRDQNGSAILNLAQAAGAKVHHFGELKSLHPKILRHPIDRLSFLRQLQQSDAVVASAGLNLLAEAIALKKPVLALFRRGDHEQQMNAQWIAHANLGVAAAIESCSPSTIQDFLQRVQHRDFSTYPIWEAMRPVSAAVLQSVQEYI